MTNAQVKAYAKSQGYEGAEYLGKWRGYDVYNPNIAGASETNPAIVGLPLIILVKGDKIRMSTPDEAFAYLDTIEDIEE